MAQLAKTFDEWRIIFYFAPRGSEMEGRALQEMGHHATIFGQWLDVWSNAPVNGDLHTQAETRLIALADNPTDVADAKKRDALIAPRWQRLLEISVPCSQMEHYAEDGYIRAIRNSKSRSREG
jgi:hypothetical protein